jgi:hypothetical protein
MSVKAVIACYWGLYGKCYVVLHGLIEMAGCHAGMSIAYPGADYTVRRP